MRSPKLSAYGGLLPYLLRYSAILLLQCVLCTLRFTAPCISPTFLWQITFAAEGLVCQPVTAMIPAVAVQHAMSKVCCLELDPGAAAGSLAGKFAREAQGERPAPVPHTPALQVCRGSCASQTLLLGCRVSTLAAAYSL